MFSFMCFSGCRGLRFEQTGRNLQHSERRNAERSANGFSADARKLSVFAQSYSYKRALAKVGIPTINIPAESLKQKKLDRQRSHKQEKQLENIPLINFVHAGLRVLFTKSERPSFKVVFSQNVKSIRSGVEVVKFLKSCFYKLLCRRVV